MINTTMKSNKQTGFTLFELMISVALLGIIASIATPSYQNFIRRKTVNQTSRDFEAALKIASHNARTTNHAVTVCAVTDIMAKPNNCQNWTILESAGAAQPGWIVFRDSNNNQILDNNETIYQSYSLNSDKTKMVWHGNGQAIAVASRSTTGNTGTMQVYAPHGSYKLPKWDSTNKPALSKSLNEVRVSISGLGKITYTVK